MRSLVMLRIGFWSTAFVVMAGPLMFQYVLWLVFAQDIPWYADIIAGLILYRYHLPALFAITLVLRHCDYSVPLFRSVKTALGY